MSMLLMVRAMACKIGNPARKLVLLKLADNANDEGECYPSYQYIADCCEISKRSAIDHVNRLEKDGYLSITSRFHGSKNRSNVYKLHFPVDKLSTPSADSAPHSANSAPLDSANSAPITSHSSNQSNKPAREAQEKKVFNDFEKPSVSEIADYCRSIKSSVNAKQFFDYYEKRDWFSGGQRMVSWRNAVEWWSARKQEKERLSMPADDSKLQAWAVGIGLRKARVGESAQQYRIALQRDFDLLMQKSKGDE